jgi:hypothetical protein
MGLNTPNSSGGGGGGGDASAANQTTGNASLSSIDGKLTNAATTTKQDTGNTSLASIDTKLTNAATTTKQDTGNTSLASIDTKVTNAGTPVLGAGTNTVGAVFDLSSTVVASSFTRPADTTAYASGDLVANSTTAGSVAPVSFSIARANDKPVTIFRAKLRKSTTSTTNALFRIHLFAVSPTVTNGDNGALACTGSNNYIGFFDIDMTQNTIFSDGAVANGQLDVGSAAISKPVSGAQTVLALVEARAAYTPGNAETFTITLEFTQS